MQPYPWERVCSDSHPVPPSILVAPSLSSTNDGGVQICRSDYIFLQSPPRWGGWKRSCLNHPESIRKAVSQLTRACIKGTLWAQWTSWEAFWRPGVYRSVLWWLGTMDQFWIRWYFGSSKTSPRGIKETRFTTIFSFWGRAGSMGARQEAASPMSSSSQGSRNTQLLTLRMWKNYFFFSSWMCLAEQVRPPRSPTARSLPNLKHNHCIVCKPMEAKNLICPPGECTFVQFSVFLLSFKC